MKGSMKKNTAIQPEGYFKRKEDQPGKTIRSIFFQQKREIIRKDLIRVKVCERGELEKQHLYFLFHSFFSSLTLPPYLKMSLCFFGCGYLAPHKQDHFLNLFLLKTRSPFIRTNSPQQLFSFLSSGGTASLPKRFKRTNKLKQKPDVQGQKTLFLNAGEQDRLKCQSPFSSQKVPRPGTNLSPKPSDRLQAVQKQSWVLQKVPALLLAA